MTTTHKTTLKINGGGAYLSMAICLFFNLEIFSQNTFPASGNVGIGTTSPTETLQVIGSIKADTIIFPDGSIQTSAR